MQERQISTLMLPLVVFSLLREYKRKVRQYVRILHIPLSVVFVLIVALATLFYHYTPNPTKAVCTRTTTKQMIGCICGENGYVATVPLENSDSLVVYRKSLEKLANHSSPWQCELSHISPYNSIFCWSKPRIDGSSG